MILLVLGPVMAQTRRALVIGISEYLQNGEDSWAAIHGSNDAELIVPILQGLGFKTNKICNKAATASKIRKGIKNLVEQCRRGDIVYLHFSGHGQAFEDIDCDEEDGWDESIIPYDAQKIYRKGKYEGANHITDDELSDSFRRIRGIIGSKGFLCVVIDACYAGGASRGDDETDDDDEVFVRGTNKGFSPHEKEFRPRINAKGHFKIPKEAGLGDMVILEACRSYQSNYEIKQDGKFYGPLSYYISQVISKAHFSSILDMVLEVKSKMAADKRLARQNMVYETSLE